MYNNLDDLVSSEKSHQFDISSETASDREQEFILNLGSESAKESTLTLRIFDLDDKDRLNPILSRKVINNTFMELDF